MLKYVRACRESSLNSVPFGVFTFNFTACPLQKIHHATRMKLVRIDLNMNGDSDMTLNVENNSSSRAMTPGQRISGRVGFLSNRDQISDTTISESHLQEIQILYQRLLDLRDRDETELTKAISYGLKLLSGRRPKKKSDGFHISGSRSKNASFEALKS